MAKDFQSHPGFRALRQFSPKHLRAGGQQQVEDGRQMLFLLTHRPAGREKCDHLLQRSGQSERDALPDRNVERQSSESSGAILGGILPAAGSGRSSASRSVRESRTGQHDGAAALQIVHGLAAMPAIHVVQHFVFDAKGLPSAGQRHADPSGSVRQFEIGLQSVVADFSDVRHGTTARHPFRS